MRKMLKINVEVKYKERRSFQQRSVVFLFPLLSLRFECGRLGSIRLVSMRFFELGQSNLADPGTTNSTQVIPFWPTNISNSFGRLTSKNWAGNVGGRRVKKNPEGGGPEDGGPKGGGIPVFFSPLPPRFRFFLSREGLLVELWPRVEAQISRLGFSGIFCAAPKATRGFTRDPNSNFGWAMALERGHNSTRKDTEKKAIGDRKKSVTRGWAVQGEEVVQRRKGPEKGDSEITQQPHIQLAPNTFDTTHTLQARARRSPSESRTTRTHTQTHKSRMGQSRLGQNKKCFITMAKIELAKVECELGLGFQVQGSGFIVWDLTFRFQARGLVLGQRFRNLGLGLGW